MGIAQSTSSLSITGGPNAEEVEKVQGVTWEQADKNRRDKRRLEEFK